MDKTDITELAAKLDRLHADRAVDGLWCNVHPHDMLAILAALRQPPRDARLSVIEECARVADKITADYAQDECGQVIAAAIRALAQEAPATPPKVVPRWRDDVSDVCDYVPAAIAKDRGHVG